MGLISFRCIMIAVVPKYFFGQTQTHRDKDSFTYKKHCGSLQKLKIVFALDMFICHGYNDYISRFDFKSSHKTP
jgi:hypothetical protein